MALLAKNEEVQSKNEGARALKTLNIDFSDTKCQLIPPSVMGPGQILNSFEIL